MDDFDRFLETALRRMIDPVAAGRPPERRVRREASEPIEAITETPAGAPVAEPAAAVAPAPTV